jgi:hypothetical protein
MVDRHGNSFPPETWNAAFQLALTLLFIDFRV